jgi:hypothetical protein
MKQRRRKNKTRAKRTRLTLKLSNHLEATTKQLDKAPRAFEDGVGSNTPTMTTTAPAFNMRNMMEASKKKSA